MFSLLLLFSYPFLSIFILPFWSGGYCLPRSTYHSCTRVFPILKPVMTDGSGEDERRHCVYGSAFLSLSRCVAGLLATKTDIHFSRTQFEEIFARGEITDDTLEASEYFLRLPPEGEGEHSSSRGLQNVEDSATRKALENVYSIEGDSWEDDEPFS